mgnify:CR=1 FL=1
MFVNSSIVVLLLHESEVFEFNVCRHFMVVHPSGAALHSRFTLLLFMMYAIYLIINQ